MKNKSLLKIFSGVLILTLASGMLGGCAIGDYSKQVVSLDEEEKENDRRQNEEEDNEIPEDETVNEDNEDENLVNEDTVSEETIDISDYVWITDDDDVVKYDFVAHTDWQQAYYDKLCEIESDYEELMYGDTEIDYDMVEIPYGYYLYDIDKDGVPEFIMEYGTCEADFHAYVFSYKDGVIEDYGLIWMGHTGLCTYPAGNGVVAWTGHSGYASINILKIENGELVAENILEESLCDPETGEYIEDKEYTVPSEIIEGSASILMDTTLGDFYLGQYDAYLKLQEVPANDNVEDNSEDTDLHPENQVFEAALNNEVPIYAVAGDQFMNSYGLIYCDALMREDVIYPYMQGGAVIVDCKYVDLNGDGQNECVLGMVDEESADDYSSYSYAMILNIQEGTIYGYLMFYPDYNSISADGRLIYDSEWSHSEKRILFNLDRMLEVYL